MHSRVLPRWMAWVLMIFGVLTIPILFATPLPIGPDWASDFLAFLLTGAAYAVVGIRMMGMPKPGAAYARKTEGLVSSVAK